jgi:Na+-driven multidrug efflux pump
MLINLASTIFLRLAGVLVVVFAFGGGLAAVWAVLAGELFIRGVLIFIRFEQGGWRHKQV